MTQLNMNTDVAKRIRKTGGWLRRDINERAMTCKRTKDESVTVGGLALIRLPNMVFLPSQEEKEMITNVIRTRKTPTFVDYMILTSANY